ncbi:molybdopterin-guanine dinucleotide biosynthesis protein MobA, partial [Xenorhabdus bovienii]|nr:molybdopterin-guanine dinucleotide biosynthesis protein MobA [Xenorhabdus bovienii]
HHITYKTANDSFTKIRLQYAARELELKYNWTYTNGFFAVNEDKEIVRVKRDNQPVPAGAKALEYYADVESLHTYATTECGFKI